MAETVTNGYNPKSAKNLNRGHLSPESRAQAARTFALVRAARRLGVIPVSQHDCEDVKTVAEMILKLGVTNLALINLNESQTLLKEQIANVKRRIEVEEADQAEGAKTDKTYRGHIRELQRQLSYLVLRYADVGIKLLQFRPAKTPNGSATPAKAAPTTTAKTVGVGMKFNVLNRGMTPNQS